MVFAYLLSLKALLLLLFRMMIYATDIVNTVSEDVACTNGDCYSLCGSISHPPGLDKYKTNVTIRDFYLKLSDIPARISMYYKV